MTVSSRLVPSHRKLESSRRAEAPRPSRGGSFGAPRQVPLIVAWLTSMPNLSSPPSMRGAPQNRLAELILRIRSRISAFDLGRPERRDRLNVKALAVRSDHGRWFDEYQGIEELKPHSVKQHPEQTVDQEEAKAARALPPRDDNPMSQVTSSSSSDARLLTRKESRKNESRETRADSIVIMHPDGVVVAREILNHSRVSQI